MQHFKIRTTLPEYGNKLYNTTSAGGYSKCVVGKPNKEGRNVLSNCVGFACSRFNEIYNEKTGNTKMKYTSLNCNAENFIERAKSIGLEIVDYPVLGGIMVWQKGNTLKNNDGAGHVEVVEDIFDSNNIYTSASNYGGTTFYNSKRSNTNGRWGMGSSYKFRGCIVNPAIGIVTERNTNEESSKSIEWTTGKYKLLVAKSIRKNHNLENNIIKVKQCTAATKKVLTSTNPNNNAKIKVGTQVAISKIYNENGRIWGAYGNCWIVLCNIDGTPQATKIN